MPDGSDSAKMLMITPTLAKIGGGDIDIQNFVVNDSDMAKTTIQLMNDKGQWDEDKQSFWYAEFNDGQNVIPAGWYDQLGMELKEFTIKQSEAVFATVQESGVSFSSAGEVAGEFDAPLPSVGFAMVGNSSPVKRSVNDFTIKGGSDMAHTSIQFMTDDGKWDGDKISFWYAEFNDGQNVIPAGWYDQLGMELHEFDINPGESVFISTQDPDLTLTFTVPAAIQ